MKKERKVGFEVLIFTLIRIVINSSFRMVYPFLPHISRGLDISLAQAARALSLRSLAGVISPVFASIADSRGRKAGMLFGLALVILGISVVVIWPTYIGLVIGLVLSTIGKFTHDPSMQAYLGDKVPYEKRGTVLAITEMGWSGSYFLGMPFIAFLIARSGWLAPFPALAILSLIAFIVLYWMLPKDQPSQEKKPKLFQNFSKIFQSRSAMMALAMVLFISFSNEVINLVFGVWLEDAFKLQVAALGLASIVIGISELTGESLVSLVADRIGIKRAIGIGLIANLLAALMLSYIAQDQVTALIALFIFYFSFEFAFVSMIPLMTEILPQARATLMAVNIATTAVGRTVAAWLVPTIFSFGFATNTYVSAVFCLLSLIALQRVSLPNEMSKP